MQSKRFFYRLLSVAVLALFAIVQANAQDPDEIIRTETSLVQLNIGVVDKQELRLWVNELLDKPGTRYPVYLDMFSRDPFHRSDPCRFRMGLFPKVWAISYQPMPILDYTLPFDNLL